MSTSCREMQKAQLKERLYETGLRLFRESGYDRTTVQQITEEVGVAKGTFFNYFHSKDQILAEWYRRLTLDALAEVRGVKFPSNQDAILALVDSLAMRAAAEPELWDRKAENTGALLVHEERTLDDELSRFCAIQIALGKARGDLAADLDVTLLADTIVTVLTGTGHAWVVARHGFDLREVAGARVAFLFRAATVDLNSRGDQP